VYTDDPYIPLHAKEHYAKFMNAMLGETTFTANDFQFNYRRGVIKHSKLPYIQIKSVADTKQPTPKPALYAAFLPYFIRDIMRMTIKYAGLENLHPDILKRPMSCTFEVGIEETYKDWVNKSSIFRNYKFLPCPRMDGTEIKLAYRMISPRSTEGLYPDE